MKRLIHISPKIYLALILIIILSFALITMLLFTKVESTYKTSLFVKDNLPSFIVSPSEIYHFSDNNEIVIKMDNALYRSHITKIYFDQNNNYFILNVAKLPFKLIPNSKINVSLIYEYKTILSSIVNV